MKKDCKYCEKGAEGYLCTCLHVVSKYHLQEGEFHCGGCGYFESRSGALTHSELVAVAHRLLDYLHYDCIVTEPGYRKELPDAIGFKNTLSLLVECKASRADFLKDKKKPFRAEGKGMGTERVYLTNKGVAYPWDVPPKWKLAWAINENEVIFLKPWFTCSPLVPYGRGGEEYFAHRERDMQAEIDMLYSWCYRKNHGFDQSVPRTGVKFSGTLASAPKWQMDDLKRNGFCAFCKHRDNPVRACEIDAIIVKRPWNGEGNFPGTRCSGYVLDEEYVWSKETWKNRQKYWPLEDDI